MKIYYSWAYPAFASGSPVDHTWVTTYDSRTAGFADLNAVKAANERYWFCWGEFHNRGGTPERPDGFLSSASGDDARSSCLVGDNADSRDTAGARGTVFIYGVDGVCHQLANQVLSVTSVNGAPLTVLGARGYVASTFLYGTYGLQRAAWASKQQSCVGLKMEAALAMNIIEDDFDLAARRELQDEPDLLRGLLALKGQVHTFNAQAVPGFLPPSASTLNARNQHLLNQAALLLGPERFERLFGIAPGERIDLVEPGMAVNSQEQLPPKQQ